MILYSSQEEYDEDVVKIEELFTPLVLKCKENGRAMRIGTNHGQWLDADLPAILFLPFCKVCSERCSGVLLTIVEVEMNSESDTHAPHTSSIA